MRDSKASARHLIVLSAAWLSCALGQPAPVDWPEAYVDDLEARFANAPTASFTLVRQSSQLPADIRQYFTRWGDRDGPAEWGEAFNTGDAAGAGSKPGTQHVLSWMSSHFAVIVFQAGGASGVRVNFLLVDRMARRTCRYQQAPDYFPRMISLESLQSSFRIESGSSANGVSCQADLL